MLVLVIPSARARFAQEPSQTGVARYKITVRFLQTLKFEEIQARKAASVRTRVCAMSRKNPYPLGGGGGV